MKTLVSERPYSLDLIMQKPILGILKFSMNLIFLKLFFKLFEMWRHRDTDLLSACLFLEWFAVAWSGWTLPKGYMIILCGFRDAST